MVSTEWTFFFSSRFLLLRFILGGLRFGFGVLVAGVICLMDLMIYVGFVVLVLGFVFDVNGVVLLCTCFGGFVRGIQSCPQFGFGLGSSWGCLCMA